MQGNGIDVEELQSRGIKFHAPNIHEFGIYRLISEVSHTLSGLFCACHRPKENCHWKSATHLSKESDGDYGIHVTSTSERWQLLNFYQHVFSQPNFNAKRMQEAKRTVGHHKLEQYLSTLVPDMRRRIWDGLFADAMFLKFQNTVDFRPARPDCRCVVPR